MKQICTLMSLMLITSALSLRLGHALAQSRAPTTVPKDLTYQGRLLWDLEGLLKRTFGREGICTWYRDPRSPWKFNDVCAPLASFQLYRYAFANPGRSPLRLVSTYHRYRDFGNYPAPVLIEGRLIACDPHDRTFLIDYQSARSLTLGCLRGAVVNYRWPEVRRERAGRGVINVTAPAIKVGGDWALDWDYSCPSSVRSVSQGSLRIQIANRRTGVRATYGGKGRAFSGEQIFPRLWAGRWHVHIRTTASKGVRQDCRWDVWVID